MPTPRVVKSLTSMEFDEVSLVDRSANQFADVAISKRAPEEDQMPELYHEDGTLLDETNAYEGATVYDEDGEPYVLEADQVDAGDDDADRDEVHKAFTAPRTPVSKGAQRSFADIVMEDVSKAMSDEARDEVIRNAFAALEQENQQAYTIAKSERDLRLEREYIAKADTYGLPIDSNELGPVLYRMVETMDHEDVAVIAKALEAAGEATSAMFDEIGQQGGGANGDVMQAVDAMAGELITKGAGDMDIAKAQAVTTVFDNNPDGYAEYLRDQRGF